MKKRLPILLISAAMALHAVAQTPPAPPPAGAGTPSLEEDTRKAFGAITSSLATGWQRMTRFVDSFLRQPPAPVVEFSPSSVAKTVPSAQPPATSALAAKPVQVAIVPPPAAPVSTPPPPVSSAEKPAAVAATPPPAPASAPAQPAKSPVLLSSLPVQPAAPVSPQPRAAASGLSATQTLVHPIATNTNLLKYLVSKYTPTKQPAQTVRKGSPISLNVRRIVKRKYMPDSADFPYMGNSARSNYRETASLHITVENLSPQLLTNVVVQWAVVKKAVARDSRAKPVVYGARESITLKPIDEKSIETPLIEVEGRADQNVGRSSGEIFRGHAVQILIGTNVVAEEILPTTLKVSFKNLQPVPKPPPNE